MNSDQIIEKGQAALEKYKLQNLKKQLYTKIKYSQKIDEYLLKVKIDEITKISDIQIAVGKVSSFATKEQILSKAIDKKYYELTDFNNNLLECSFIIRATDIQTFVIIFFGNENRAFKKIMERKALQYKNIPHVVEGKIVGVISLSDIMKVLMNYDKEYAFYLKELYNKSFEKK